MFYNRHRDYDKLFMRTRLSLSAPVRPLWGRPESAGGGDAVLATARMAFYLFLLLVLWQMSGSQRFQHSAHSQSDQRPAPPSLPLSFFSPAEGSPYCHPYGYHLSGFCAHLLSNPTPTPPSMPLWILGTLNLLPPTFYPQPHSPSHMYAGIIRTTTIIFLTRMRTAFGAGGVAHHSFGRGTRCGSLKHVSTASKRKYLFMFFFLLLYLILWMNQRDDFEKKLHFNELRNGFVMEYVSCILYFGKSYGLISGTWNVYDLAWWLTVG